MFLGFVSPQNGCTNPRINSRAARVSVKILCISSEEAQAVAELRRGAGRHARGNAYPEIVVSASDRAGGWSQVMRRACSLDGGAFAVIDERAKPSGQKMGRDLLGDVAPDIQARRLCK